MGNTTEWITCPMCQGWGYIALGTTGYTETCPQCRGAGEVRK